MCMRKLFVKFIFKLLHSNQWQLNFTTWTSLLSKAASFSAEITVETVSSRIFYASLQTPQIKYCLITALEIN